VKYRVDSLHAEELADGPNVAPGDVVELDKDQIELPVNQALIERGVLIELEEVEDKSTTRKKKEADSS
jgi:hypothetical protein